MPLGTTMNFSPLHHVSLVTSNLERATEFYRDVFGFRQIDRPPFSTAGTWFAFGSSELHLIVHPGGTFRNNSTIDTADAHFAIRVEDFEAAIRHFAAKGFREDAADGDPKRIVVNRKSTAGYPQAYLLDVDRNIIEINAAG
jgi:catechol 2,3-dioxygenase-like lactoylglutathione lyase family enzyme